MFTEIFKNSLTENSLPIGIIMDFIKYFQNSKNNKLITSEYIFP